MTSEPIGVKGLIEVHQIFQRLGIAELDSPSLSTYGYAYGNPLIFFDPDGLMARSTPEGAVMQAVLNGNKSQLNFLMKNVLYGKFSPAKKLLLRKKPIQLYMLSF